MIFKEEIALSFSLLVMNGSFIQHGSHLVVCVAFFLLFNPKLLVELLKVKVLPGSHCQQVGKLSY